MQSAPTAPATPPTQAPAKLRYHCSQRDCYGRGFNFGTTPYHWAPASPALPSGAARGEYRAASAASLLSTCRGLFQSQSQLDYWYSSSGGGGGSSSGGAGRGPSAATSVLQQQQRHSLCDRVECVSTTSAGQFFDSVVYSPAGGVYSTSTSGGGVGEGGNTGPVDGGGASAVSVAAWLRAAEGVLFALWAGDAVMHALAAVSLTDYIFDPCR